MTRLLSSRRLRWTVPALVAAGVAAAAVTATSGAGASEQPNLPARTAAQLLVALQQAHPAYLSGTIVETAKLGLPTLPSSGPAGEDGLSPQALATGSHTMRIWYAGPNRQRIAVLAPLAERDVIHNGTDLWTYTSTTNEVTHATVGSAELPSSSDVTGSTPQQAAQQALRAIDPTTRVTVDRTARVAGRPAYQLVLTPRDSRSLIGSVRIAIDSATSTPLRVQIFAKGASMPAIQVGFTDVSFSAPNPSVFRFVPPAGATVKQQGGSDSGRQQGDGATGDAQGTTPGESGVPGVAVGGEDHRVLGDGWTTVVELSSGGSGGYRSELLYHLSTPVPAGRLITTALLSVLVTNDGHVFVGPVSGAAIQQVAATGRGL